MSLLKRRPIGTYLLNSLIVFVPISIILEFLHGDPLWIFISSGLAIIPLAGWMGKATEYLAEHLGEGIGGLLNATFGNAAELIIALFALRAGLHEVVKASITGSIIGNILLVLGLSMVAGGIRFPIQQFNRTAASIGSSLLILSAIGLVVPAIFHYITQVATYEWLNYLYAIDNPKMSPKDSPEVESQMKENPCGRSNHRNL
jgi:Ca2+:H+ antiporter